MATTSNKSNSSNSDAPTTERTAETIQALLDRITEQATEAETRIRKAAQEAEGGLRNRAGDARQNAKELTAGVEDYMHNHPALALGIAFVGGMFLSSFLKRR